MKDIKELKGFQVIYADPPWKYEFSKSDSRKIENQYPTMELKDIQNLPVKELSAEDSVLFLWVTSPKLEEGLSVIKAWGFQYVTNAMWDKKSMGMGYYFRQQHEILLIGKKGNLPLPKPEDRVSSVISVRRREHSSKPDVIYEILEKMYPNRTRVELFGRSKRVGWTTWGDECGPNNSSKFPLETFKRTWGDCSKI